MAINGSLKRAVGKRLTDKPIADAYINPTNFELTFLLVRIFARQSREVSDIRRIRY